MVKAGGQVAGIMFCGLREKTDIVGAPSFTVPDVEVAVMSFTQHSFTHTHTSSAQSLRVTSDMKATARIKNTQIQISKLQSSCFQNSRTLSIFYAKFVVKFGYPLKLSAAKTTYTA